MKKKPSSTRAKKTNQPKKFLGALPGAAAERRWLLVVSVLLLVIVVAAGAVTYFKYQRGDYKHLGIEKMSSESLGEREQRIREIMASIELDESYVLVNEDVFGDKRQYEWDEGRTFSSSREYRRDADVAETHEDVRRAVEAAGYEFFDEAYPDSVASQYHFRTDRGEYIRTSVISENVLTAGQNNRPLTEEERTTGPSIVTIKVNLDDNNE